MKNIRLVLVLILTVLLSNCIYALARESESPDKEPEKYDWKKSAKEMKLSDKDIEKLEKDKVLVTNIAYRQIFTPYISTDEPFFITSDSLLNAYYILYEESFFRMEKAKSKKLAGMLKFIWNNLETAEKEIKGDIKIIGDAKKRDMIIIGTALKLLGDNSIKPGKDIEPIINEEVKKIEEAKVLMKPGWLGAPDLGFVAIDYSRYKPRGFYDNSDQLKRYFRAVSWLQSIPFRIKNDEELLSILMLGNCIAHHRFSDCEKQTQLWDFFTSYGIFAGEPDDFSIINAAEDGQIIDLDKEPLSKIKENLLEKAAYRKNPSLINDQVSYKTDISYRILPLYRLPDTVLFQKFINSRINPSSLHIAAMLGSDYACSLLPSGENQRVLEESKKYKSEYSNYSLYSEYLNCLRCLVDEPEKDAPEFMKSEAWKVKSCNTVLAGWALARRALVLQAKQNYELIGHMIVPPGFVEPEPDFFSGMAALSTRTKEIFGRTGAFEPPSDNDIVLEMRMLAELFEKFRFNEKGNRNIDYDKFSKEEISTISIFWGQFCLYHIGNCDENSPEYFREFIKRLRISANELEKEEKFTYPDLVEGFRCCDFDLEELWRKLEILSLKLEALSHKELRKVDFSPEEREFLEDYGKQIAEIMLYKGESYTTPLDDSPKIVDVLYSPARKEYLEVGTCRPRALLVLYPYKGKEILCKGAILPFYEFQSRERLNDDEWKKILDSDKRPPVPQWMKPILGSEGIKRPNGRDE